MAYKKFRTWLEDADPFGFEDLRQQQRPMHNDDDMPIQSFGIQRLIDELLTKKLGQVEPDQRFNDEIRWGENTGAVRIKITPAGNISFGRLTHDLEGNMVWVCKKYMKIDMEHFQGHESSVARDIFHVVEHFASQPVDATVRGWNHLYGLVQEVTKALKRHVPEVFMYDSIKKVNEQDYIIQFALRGTGVGVVAPRNHERSRNQAPYMEVEMAYYEGTGLIRTVATTLSIDAEGSAWDIDVPFFDDKFSPMQGKEEIAKTIVSVIRYF